ncbi:MAG: hypothetical protein WCG06_02860, partial [Candidatus Omnitrophota bacterium]
MKFYKYSVVTMVAVGLLVCGLVTVEAAQAKSSMAGAAAVASKMDPKTMKVVSKMSPETLRVISKMDPATMSKMATLSKSGALTTLANSQAAAAAANSVMTTQA